MASPHNLSYPATSNLHLEMQEASQANRPNPKLLYPSLPHTVPSTLFCLHPGKLQPPNYSDRNTHTDTIINSLLPVLPAFLPFLLSPPLPSSFSFVVVFSSPSFPPLPPIPSPLSPSLLFLSFFLNRSQYVAQDSLNLPSSSFAS